MKVLLINICLRPESEIRTYPIGFGYIASSVYRAGYNFEIVDLDISRYSYEQLEELLSKKDFDVVAFGCIVTGYKIVKNLCSIIKRINKNAIIIVGNSVASSIPEILLSKTQANIAVMGEGDITIVELLKYLEEKKPLEDVDGIYFKKGNKIIATKPRRLIANLDDIPLPNWSLFDIETYIERYKAYINEPYPGSMTKEQLRVFPMNTARGCLYKCGFCYHVFRGNKYRFRSPQSIVKEIKELKRLYGINFIHFHDELTFFSKKQILGLIQKFSEEDLQIYWGGDCIASLFNDEGDLAIIEKMKEAGCVGMSYSLESADPGILKSMNKHLTLEQFSRQTNLFHRAGLPVWTSLVIGYPQETPETIRKTFDFCIQNKIYPSTGYLLPQPGSPIFDYALKNNYITDVEAYLLKMGDRQDLRLNMTSMSDEELQVHVKQGLKRCNEELNLGLKENELIKTGHYRGKK
jgi:radical SAM superfamily enzyme YgiQ (UPF0313 family)